MRRDERVNSPPPAATPGPDSAALKIVGIGASAGGLEAFTELVRNLPDDARLAYVLVQHLDPTHPSLLSELLGRSARLPVREIQQDMAVERNQIYVIPPNCDLGVSQGVLKLTPRDKRAAPARSIDHFLRSLAADQGANAIGVILSGAGSDGARGIRAIKDAGGLTFAQDEVSSKYDSMPRSAVATGAVDFVLPPAKIAEELARNGEAAAGARRRAAANVRQRTGRVTRPKTEGAATGRPSAAWPTAPEDPNLRKIFDLLRTRTAVDFGLYRMNTIRRRLMRRLSVHKLTTLASYHQYLRENSVEVDALYQDLLIGVTSFFRNPSVFEALRRKVWPKLVRSRADGDPLRIWIAGCSTGQEAYTYAMAFTEFCEEAETRAPLQIFATDVNASSLEQARSGRYSKSELEGLSAARRERFFQAEHDEFRVQKSLRDLVIFAQHNLLTDAPFTRVDLISCRNMLIYIEPALQQKILPSFHYALRPHGYLVLGTSESVGTSTALFSPVEKAHKIYLKKPGVGRPHLERPPLPAAPRSLPLTIPRREVEPSAVDAYREADRLTLSRYSPPAVLINEEGEVLQFRGKVQPYVGLPNGRATLNLFKMANRALCLPLQKAVARARKDNRPVREKAVAVDRPRHAVNIEILPIRSLPSRCFLVLFEKIPSAAKRVSAAPAAETSASSAGDARRHADLRREYADARDTLAQLREQHETVVEELQASNEEVQSSNEELQSLNEELETSNEELESANEELTTLNEELATRNVELRESEQRLREQAQLIELAPLLVRSSKDRIVLWSRGAERMYGFAQDEALGQTSHLLLAAEYQQPLDVIHAQLAQQGRWEGEVVHRRKDGTSLVVAVQWVLNTDEHQKTRTILEVHNDITARRRAEESLRKAQELNERILESTPDCIMVLDLAGRLHFLNAEGQRALSQADFSAVAGSHWSSLWAADARPAAETAYRCALGGDTGRFQARAETSNGSTRWWDVVVRPIRDRAGLPEQLLVVCRDVTERKASETATLEEARLAGLRADLALEVARGGELTGLLQQLTQTIVHHAGLVSVRIWLTEAAGPALKLQASAGHYTQLNHQQSHLLVGEGRVGAIAASKRAYVTHQLSADSAICDPEWARREGLVSFAGFPLLFESHLLGVLAVLSHQRIEPALLRELNLGADAIALLIQRKRAEDERARLLHEATEARNAALAASRAKDEFLAALSHELRTPLNPVLLLASDGAENPELPEPVRATFETIRNNVSLEAKLIDDLLDLTRIAHGKLEVQLAPLDLHAVVRQAVEIVAASADQQTVKFQVELQADASTVLGDRVRLQQVFWNILNNAVKFTPHGGTVTLRSLRPEPAVIRIQIKDSGIGLRATDLERIFDPFSQAERRHGGLGLGLAISRQLLEQHRGAIRAFSEGLSKGSTFEIDLPLVAVAPDGTAPALLPASAGASALRRPPQEQRIRLLLVEDHAPTRRTLRTLLHRRHCEVATAGSLAEARLRLADAPFDLLISDLGLPDGDGYQVVAEARQQQPGLRAIAVSGYGTKRDRDRSRAAGFSSHLTKPITLAALDEAIAEALAVAPSS